MTQTYAGATSSDGTDAVMAPQQVSRLDFALRNVGTPVAFTVSSAAIAKEPWEVTVSVSSTAGGAQRQATDEELMAGGRAFMAELEQEFGPIPADVRAEIRRKWHG
jgi:hypothetical protein